MVTAKARTSAEDQMTDITAEKTNRDDLLRMAVDVVAAYVSKNPLPAGQIPEVIHTVYASLSSLETGIPEAKSEAPKPAARDYTPRYFDAARKELGKWARR